MTRSSGTRQTATKGREQKLSTKMRLAYALTNCRETDPGYGFRDTCVFLARWIIGLSIHTRNVIETQDSRCQLPGTVEYIAAQKTISETATNELLDRAQELGRIGVVVVQARLFWEYCVWEGKPKVEPVDVPRLIYDGALMQLVHIGDNPVEVEAAKAQFRLLNAPVAGNA